MNDHDYPPSPDYYEAPDLIKVDGQRIRLNVHHVIDAWRLDYWLGSAVAHILRAGRKPGETERAAITNAWGTLIGWFRCAEWSLPVGRLETGELRAENARLRAELQAMIAVVTTMAMTPKPEPKPGNIVNEYTGDTSVASGPCPVAAALRPANIKGEWAPRPVEPADPFAGLLSVEKDHDLLDWFDGPHADVTPRAVYVGATVVSGEIVPAGWYVRSYSDVRMTARDAARILHRILTGGAP